jgi:hypothetical protein
VIKDPVIAVVVAYHPRIGELKASVKSLSEITSVKANPVFVRSHETHFLWGGPDKFFETIGHVKTIGFNDTLISMLNLYE